MSSEGAEYAVVVIWRNIVRCGKNIQSVTFLPYTHGYRLQISVVYLLVPFILYQNLHWFKLSDEFFFQELEDWGFTRFSENHTSVVSKHGFSFGVDWLAGEVVGEDYGEEGLDAGGEGMNWDQFYVQFFHEFMVSKNTR